MSRENDFLFSRDASGSKVSRPSCHLWVFQSSYGFTSPFFSNIIKTWTLSSFYIELGIYNQTQKPLVRFILCLAALRNKMISQILNNINLVNFRIFLKWWYCENVGYYWDYWPKIMSILLWSLWWVLNNKLINN